jgi:hypothetical protein
MIQEHPAIFVTGQPGIGKSQSVKEIARRLQEQTGKTTNVIDIRLLLFNPIDLRGIPVADLEERAAIWLKPQIFDLTPDENTIHLLFLDELTAAPSSLQAAAYQIALDKRLGEHKLPRNTFVIAAGNRMEDHSVVFDMPSALKNRFMHFEIRHDHNDWMGWANKHDIHPEIMTYLKYNPHRLNVETIDEDAQIIVTPRSWELLSKVLKTVGGTMKENESVVASLLGKALTRLVINHKDPIDVKDIFSGVHTSAPSDLSGVQNIVELLMSTLDDFMRDELKLKHVLEYLHVLPMDYGLRLFRRIAQYDNPVCPLTDIDAFNVYVERIGETIESD